MIPVRTKPSNTARRPTTTVLLGRVDGEVLRPESLQRWDVPIQGSDSRLIVERADGLFDGRSGRHRRWAAPSRRRAGQAGSPRSSLHLTPPVSQGAAPSWRGPRSRRSAPRRSARPSPGPPITAASPSTPVGSTMIFMRSHTNRTVATSSSSETVAMSATRARMIGKVRRAQRRRARAVGDRARVVHRLQRAAAERAVAVVPRLGLDADHAALRAAARRHQRRSREQPAAAARHDQRVELADLVQQLERGRPLPRDHVRMVEGRHQHHRRRAPAGRGRSPRGPPSPGRRRPPARRSLRSPAAWPRARPSA